MSRGHHHHQEYQPWKMILAKQSNLNGLMQINATLQKTVKITMALRMSAYFL